MLDHAWIIPLIPAASFAIILAFGKRLPRGGAEVGIAAVGVCLALAVVTNVQWFDRVNDAEHAAEVASETHGTEATAAEGEEHGAEEPGAEEQGAEEHGATAGEAEAAGEGHDAAEGEGHTEFEVTPVTKQWTWWQSGGTEFTVGTLIDGPGVMMLFVVTLVSLLVHIYSTDYVHGDRRYTHFFAFLSLFTASMLGLIMSENTLQLLTCWELVGLCSFALIGHWWEEKPNSDAALKAFLTNRVGDVGLICGVVILYFGAGTFNIVDINRAAIGGDISHLVLLVASCSLVAAVMSKSGQFILHTWLPDAMAGPTPVSALIHAATMVVAGVFMVGRLYGVFFTGLSIGTSSVNLLAVVGGVTVIGGALLAFVQSDIKKVLAYSTVSQLGYMVMALGVGAWTAAFFHLFTHAFFKACLFLGAGSVSHSVHSFDMKSDMGGLGRWMPHTKRTFMVATAALIGIFPLAGFWSKDEILAGASQLGGEYKAFMVVGLCGAVLTAAYMTRCIYLTFYGEFRGHGHPHESGPRIVVPLYVLAVLAVFAGLANLPDTGALDWIPSGAALRFEHFYEPKGAYFPSVLGSFSHPEFSLGIAVVSTLAAAASIGAVYLWYWKRIGFHGLTERNRVARAGLRLLENKYYLDALYTGVIAGGIKGPVARGISWFNQNVLDGAVNGTAAGAVRGGQWVYRRIDQGVIDGAVNGAGQVAEGSGEVFRQAQTGQVQQYAGLFFAAAAILAGLLIAAV